MPLLNDNFDDYFEENKEEVTPQQPEEETAEQREEREIKETTIERRHNKLRTFIVLGSILAILAIVGWVWSRYFHPYLESEECGYVEKVANQGVFFKTYEGMMMSEKILPDTVRRYYSDFLFTIRDDSVASAAMRAAATGKRMRLHYIEYKGNLPWRGETKRIVTAISPDTIP